MKLTKSAKIGISWAFITAGGLYAFYLSKRSIDKQRYEHMKVRERIRQSNTGEYEPSSRKFTN
ncbi:PREDICTED: uncharacterized protein LOC108568376 [Nicrophorus vespilloides]|uniref:Uncharacterized protein LOC108568376 n=1 Tax=Nicrophorus vespilloides TaxID=110193 RepID=A0ABM1NDM6_NICVS|nr:PREDICTED: uncharacterized protein LOC108568376 [Nicrophorus vespilloides]